MLFRSEAIVSGNIAEMDAVVAAEEALLLKVGELERVRREIAASVASKTKIDVAELTMSNWPGLDESRRRQADELQQSFRGTLEAISQINEVNSRLLTVHLDYVQTVINEVTRTHSEKSYDADGRASTRRTQALNLIDEIM